MFKIIPNKNFISKEIQFVLPLFICILFFLIINILKLFEISDFSYSPLILFSRFQRIITYSFVHKDINHLFSNIFGGVIIRYSLSQLNLKNKYLFFYLIILIIIIQSFILYIFNNYFLNSISYSLIGFSGVIFGTYSFLMISSFYSNNFFFNVFIGLKKNHKVFKMLLFLLSFGMIYSLLPEVSFIGHLAGIFSGIII